MNFETELRTGIIEAARSIGADPLDLATVISYETGGTFDPWKKGPVTKHGQHRGLIQWGESQRKQYGVYEGMGVRDQAMASARYLRDRGFKPGMGILDMYSAINAGSVGLYNRTDENNGGAPGTVREKVLYQMDGHKANARKLLGGIGVAEDHPGSGGFVPSPTFDGGTGGGGATELDRIDVETTRDTSSWAAPYAASPITFDPMDLTEVPVGDPGWFQLMGDAVMSQDTISALRRSAPSLAFDPTYELDKETMKELLGEELDPEYYAPWFETARSDAHAQHIKRLALDHQARKQRLGAAGLRGVGLQMAAEVLDPVAFAAEAITLGAATPFIVGMKAGRLARMASTALAGAGGAMVGETAVSPLIPNRDGWDIVEAGVYGAGFGAVVGALGRGANASEAIRVQKLAEAIREEVGAVSSSGSVGAARNIFADDELLEGTLGQLGDEVPRTFAGWTRWMDITGWLRTSKNPVTRLLGGVLAKDAADPGAFTASEEMMKHFDGFTRDYFSTFNPSFDAFLKERNIGLLQRGKRSEAFTEFSEEVARYVRDRTPDANWRYNQNVMKVGDKIRRIQNQIRELAANPYLREGGQGRAVRGFEELSENPFYLMRVWDSKKIMNARRMFGEQQIASAIEEAMRKANDSVPEQIRKKAAKAFTKAITRRAWSTESEVARKLGSEDMEEVIDILKSEGGMSADDAADLISHYRAKPESSKVPRGKKRLFMDETAEFDFQRVDGAGTERKSIQDLLLVNDSNYLFGKYVRQMSGRIAMAKVKLRDPKTGDVIQDGITSDREYSKLLSAVERKAADDGIPQAQTEQDLERLRFLGNFLSGRPLYEVQNWHDWVRAVEKFNYTRIANQFGWAQLPEFSAIISTVGIKAMMSHMPAFRRIVSNAGDMRLKDDLYNDLEVFNAYGVDVLTRNDYQRLDELSGSPFSTDRGRMVDKIEGGLNTTSHVVSTLSGMNLVNATMQRMATAATVQKFVDMAYKGKRFTKARMKAIGLGDDAMVDRVYAQLRDPANVEVTKGALTGKKIKRLNWDNWSDMEAREAFRNVLFRMTRQMVQTNDIGMMSMWMSRPLVRVFAQFRRFIFGAFTNNLLYNINLAKGGDMRAIAFFLWSTALSALTWSARTHVASIGRDDREEYLEKRLSPTSLAKAAFTRSGYSSIIPAILDTGISQAFTGSPQFDYRTSGQPMDFIFGNPTMGLINDVSNFGSAITHPLFNQRGMTTQEAHNFVRVFPFANAIPVVIGLNAMTSTLDDRPPRDDFEMFQGD